MLGQKAEMNTFKVICRHSNFYAWVTARHLLFIPYYFVVKTVASSYPQRASFGKVMICCGQDDIDFLNAAVEAMRLMEDRCPVDYRRIQKNVRIVTIGHIGDRAAAYVPFSKVCIINPSRIPRKSLTVNVGGIIANRAALGGFYDRKIPLVANARVRISKICQKRGRRVSEVLRCLRGGPTGDGSANDRIRAEP